MNYWEVFFILFGISVGLTVVLVVLHSLYLWYKQVRKYRGIKNYAVAVGKETMKGVQDGITEVQEGITEIYSYSFLIILTLNVLIWLLGAGLTSMGSSFDLPGACSLQASDLFRPWL